jgi:hypothetical protein
LNEEHGAKHLHSKNATLVARSKRNLLVSLICGASICSILTAFAPITGDRQFYSDVLGVSASGLALGFSLQVIYRQKLNALLPRLYASLGLSLGLWFAAQAIWAYYELIMEIDIPFPSIADVFWLVGYVPFFYFLVGIIRNYLGVSRSITFPLVAASTVGFALTIYILSGIYHNADLTNQEGIVSYAVASAYPIADMFLIIPAFAVFIQLRKGKLTFTPWFFIAIATIVEIIADFGFAASTSITDMAGMIWIWDPLFDIGYIAIASALFWHKSFFTIDQKKLLKDWQQQNR